MNDCTVTIASLTSVLIDPQRNLESVKRVCAQARAEGARVVVFPELMLTGHGAHMLMAKNSEPVPDGPLAQEILRLSAELGICIVVGIAERAGGAAYNSQMVADKGRYLGVQRKITMSGDEYLHFGMGTEVPVFDIGDLRFGITICYDTHFPEIAFMHHLNGADAVFCTHAARTGTWPEPPTPEFARELITKTQERWAMVHRGRAYTMNCYVLINNAVGPSTEGLPDVVANHAGTLMGIDPSGEVFLRTRTVDAFEEEIATVTLSAAKRAFNHGPTRNRNLANSLDLFRRFRERGPLVNPEAPAIGPP